MLNTQSPFRTVLRWHFFWDASQSGLQTPPRWYQFSYYKNHRIHDTVWPSHQKQYKIEFRGTDSRNCLVWILTPSPCLSVPPFFLTWKYGNNNNSIYFKVSFWWLKWKLLTKGLRQRKRYVSAAVIIIILPVETLSGKKPLHYLLHILCLFQSLEHSSK